MTWLVLFDVDGTLLLTHDDVYVEANRLALTEVYGDAPDGPDVPGDTATAHTRRALTAPGFSSKRIDAGLPRWCETFAAHYVRLLAKRAGVKLSMHRLRKGFGCRVAKQLGRGNAPVLHRLMRHSSMQLTMEAAGVRTLR